MIKEIVKGSFQGARQASIDNGYIESNQPNNAKKSSVFVSMLGDAIMQKNPELEVRYQKVDKTGKKSKGEWLFDVCAGRTSRHVEKSEQKTVMTSLVWVIESELNSSLKKFDEDFSKLLIAKSENLLLVCGDMTKTDSGSQEFIKTRIKSTTEFLNSVALDRENLFLAFIPYTKYWELRKGYQCSVFNYKVTEKIFVEL